MTLREDLESQHLLDEYGLVRTREWENSGNPIRYTAEAALFDSSFRGFEYYVKSEKPGLYFKAPILYGQRFDQVSVDDLIPLTHYFHATGQLEKANEVLQYLIRHWGFYTTNPSVSLQRRLIGRNFSMMGHLYYAAGKLPPWPFRWAHEYAIRHTDFTGQDETVLSWHCLRTSEKHLPREVYVNWRSSFYKQWPEGMRGLLREYFGFNHPLSERWIEWEE